ncbi:putative signal transducing protein [Treponema sp. R6D11]
MIGDWAELKHATTLFEAEIIIALLREEGILAKKVALNDGGIRTGVALFGVKILVLEEDLEKAKEIVDGIPEQEEGSAIEDGKFSLRRGVTWVLLCLVVLPAVVAIIMMVLYMLGRI